MTVRPLYDDKDVIGGDRSKGRPRFPIRSPLRPIVHLLPFVRYRAFKFDRKRFRPDDDVIRLRRRRMSIEDNLETIGCPLKRNVHLLPFARYNASKLDRKRFRPHDDFTGPIRLRHSIEGHRLSIGSPLTRNVHLASLPRYGGRKIVSL